MISARASLALLLLFGLAPAAFASDEPLRIAVASNFGQAAEALLSAFRETHTGSVTLSRGSTGKLYAQIVNGAPFHVFLAADAERPERLEKAGLAVAGSRFTYAQGRLVLWSRDPSYTDRDCVAALRDAADAKVALANPQTAPYGAAARETIEALSLWSGDRGRWVFGENVSQALQFAASGNATFGFVAAAQLRSASLPETACRWDVPEDLHAPILQQAVLLKRGLDHPAASSFVEFLASEPARAIIRQHDYRLGAP